MSDFTVVYGRLTSKSTFSPSGIFGALMLGMNLWKEEEYMLTKILHFTDLMWKKHTTYFCLGFDSSGMKNSNVMCTKKTFF